MCEQEKFQYIVSLCLRFHKQSQYNRFFIYRPWAIRVGTEAHFLMNIFYEKRWEQVIDIDRVAHIFEKSKFYNTAMSLKKLSLPILIINIFVV